MRWQGKIDFDKPIEINGKPHGLEHITTLTAWISTDEGRLVHAEDTGSLWFGNSTMWVEATPGAIPANYDDRYYTETEIDAYFEGESGTGKKQVDWVSLTTVPTDFTPSSHGNEAHTATFAIVSDVTFETLNTNGDMGTAANQIAIGSHNHDTIYTLTADLISTANAKGASLVSIEAIPTIASTNVQGALEELQIDVAGITEVQSMDDAYNNGSVVAVDSTSVDFQLTDTYSLKATSDAGVTTVFEANANALGDNITINAIVNIEGNIVPQTTASDLGTSTNKFGQLWAQEGHFDEASIYLGTTHAIKVVGGKIQLSNDNVSFYDIVERNELETGSSGIAIDWSNVANAPSFSLDTHNHDARYYTESEIDTTLSGYSVTSHNHDTTYLALAGGTISSDLIIDGNLTINGTTTTLDSVNTEVADATFTIKTAATPIDGSASFEVQRATANAKIMWEETTDKWQLDPGTTVASNILVASDISVLVPALVHSHDDLYYTESEIDTTLSGYSLTSHNHDLAYANIIHSHDDLYYTESEIDTTLSGYSVTSHNHDTVYYTETEIDNFINGLQPVNIYDTEANIEIDNTVTKGTFALSSDSDKLYVGNSIGNGYINIISETQLNTAISAINVDAATYEALVAAGDVGTGVDQVAQGDHNHDARYYTETEIDTTLSGYSVTSHNHTGVYEPVITKLTAFNLDLGTIAGTVTEGDDVRLSDARTPVSHNNTYHSETYITTAGVTYETLSTNLDVGTAADQVAQGDHNHDAVYYTESEIDTKFSEILVPSTTGTPIDTPVSGTVRFDASTNILYIYNGTSWVSTTLA